VPACLQEEQGQLLQETLHHGEVIGKEFKPPGSRWAHDATEIVCIPPDWDT
jgi:hypothetical protein